MNYKLVVFGAVAGGMWSLVPGALSEMFRSGGESVSVIVSGTLTGIVVSAVLYRPLQRVRAKGALVLGVVSLPLGAFIFGIVISVTHLLVQIFTGMSYRFSQYGFRPLSAGLDYALFSVISIFALGLFPFAMFTTWCLRRSIRRPQDAH